VAGQTSSEQFELVQLRRKMRRLEMENEGGTPVPDLFEDRVGDRGQQLAADVEVGHRSGVSSSCARIAERVSPLPWPAGSPSS